MLNYALCGYFTKVFSRHIILPWLLEYQSAFWLQATENNYMLVKIITLKIVGDAHKIEKKFRDWVWENKQGYLDT